MADFTIAITNKYGTKTYQDTKDSYDWIVKALHKGDFSDLTIKAVFLFRLSEIRVECKSIEEFIENAYGRTDYDFISLYLSAYSNDKRIAFISFGFDGQISISTESKSLLERIINLIQNTSLDEPQINHAIPVTNVVNNSVKIYGNNNTVAHNHSVAVTSAAERDSKIWQWVKAVIQSLLANWIWLLLGLAIPALLGFLAKKG